MEATKRQLQEEFCGLVLTYQVNDTLLCVPVEHVESVIEPPQLTEIPGAPPYVMGAFMHRGKTALALSLKTLLRLPASEAHSKKESLLVVWMGDQPIGYWVDEIKGMTDSGRGHWSAVPALIRDQGITRALVCDGNVYFPLDLTQSTQFREISHTLEMFEKNRVHEVTEADVQRAQQQAAQALLDEQQESLAPAADTEILEDDYTVAEYPADSLLEEDYEEHIETSALAEHEPDTISDENQFDTSMLARQMYEAQFQAEEAAAEMPELEFDDNGQADAFLSELHDGHVTSVELIPDVVDEASNEAVIDEAQVDAFDPAYLEQLKPQQPELLFDEHGQADAFLELLADFEHITAEVEQDVIDEIIDEQVIEESQIDAFDPVYLEMLAQEALPATVEEEELTVTEEPYSYLPTSLPEDDDIVEQELDYEKIFTDEEIGEDEQALLEEDEESVTDEGLLEEALPLTEEPYSFLPDSLPGDDEVIESPVDEEQELQPVALLTHNTPELEIDESDLEENVETVFDEDQLEDTLPLTEEPYSFLPDSLQDDDEVIESPVDEEQESQPVALLTHDTPAPEADESALEESDKEVLPLTEEPYSFLPDSLPDDDEIIESPVDEEQESQPVALLAHDIPEMDKDETVDESGSPTDLPDMRSTLVSADYLTDKIAESYTDDFIEETEELDNQVVPVAREEIPVAAPEQDSGFVSEIPYELDLDAEEEVEPEPARAKAPVAPVLPGGIIIRPDGQVSKSFGLIKVFTIVLATSAAGTWWFRDELFHKEHIRKEIPSILQNEIAYLYSERVRIVNPPRGRERMVVETPDEEITVIKRKYVNRELYRERRQKGVKLHRVRRGDTLWDIAKKYLADPYRYPELAENNRIHNPNLIRPGDVVKIKVKQAAKK